MDRIDDYAELGKREEGCKILFMIKDLKTA